MTNGPVEAGFTVYADFPSYKSGMFCICLQLLLNIPVTENMKQNGEADIKAVYYSNPFPTRPAKIAPFIISLYPINDRQFYLSTRGEPLGRKGLSKD